MMTQVNFDSIGGGGSANSNTGTLKITGKAQTQTIDTGLKNITQFECSLKGGTSHYAMISWGTNFSEMSYLTCGTMNTLNPSADMQNYIGNIGSPGSQGYPAWITSMDKANGIVEIRTPNYVYSGEWDVEWCASAN